MRLLLDECLPRKLKGGLPGHEVKTVPERLRHDLAGCWSRRIHSFRLHFTEGDGT